MASFIRSKQAGVHKNLSADILPEYFAPNDQARIGINSQIGCLAYDPVQSLLAIGTNESRFGNGQIYVFGQQRVQNTFSFSRQTSVRLLHFCASRLISLSSKNELVIWDLAKKRLIASTTPPGVITALATDPTLDWAFVGFQNGRILAYDLDRFVWAPLKLPNFWHEKMKRSTVSPVVSIQLHPRDIGQLLIGYTEAAVIYSFKLNKATKFFDYNGASQSSATLSNPIESIKLHKSNLTQVFWHPSGSYIGTAYDDSALVFWDSKDGRILTSKRLNDNHVNKSNSPIVIPNALSRKPFCKISWCCKENPESTAILVASGTSSGELSLIELGTTPVYATATWQNLKEYFEGKHQTVIHTPPDAEILDFCLIPRNSPYNSNSLDPIAIIVLLTSGELVTLSYPEGHLISPTNQLHPSISFVHPFVTHFNICKVSRTHWLSMIEKRVHGPLLLKGGREIQKPLNLSEDRFILLVAHGDGTIRIWDSGPSDQVENSKMLQVDVARALEKYKDVNITSLSMGSQTRELAIGTTTGELVLYAWGKNRFYGKESSESVRTITGNISDISARTEPSLDEGFQPKYLYNMGQGPITTVKTSNIGFIAVGSENGEFSIIDLRGPTIICNRNLNDFTRSSKRSGFIKVKGVSSHNLQDWPVLIEFGILNLDDDNFSSICCFVGTNYGSVITFKVFPDKSGIYTAEYAGQSSLSDKIISITPLGSESGKLAEVTREKVGVLRSGTQTNGVLVAVSQTEIRLFKPSKTRGAQKSFDNFFCEAASVVFGERGCVLVGVFGDATIRAFSLPGLKEINSTKISSLDSSRLSASIVTTGGTVFSWTGPTELAVIHVWGTAQPLPKFGDHLFNPQITVPPRPTISNIEWLIGTQYLSPQDLDILVGGPDRPPSTRMYEPNMKSQDQNCDGQVEAQGSESWGDYMARQINERTEKLDLVGDNLNKIQQSSQSWANDVSKFVKKQKRGMMLGAISGKFS